MKTYRLQSICMLVALLAVNFFTSLWLQGTSIPTAWASALGQEAPVQTVEAAVAPTAFVMPTTFNYQGYVRNPDGTLMTGTHKITARLYAQPTGDAAALYTFSREGVSVRDGLFNIVLGEEPYPFPAGLFQNNASLFLGITLDNDQELIPRQRLHAVPWALSASTLTPGATVNLNGLTATGPVALNADANIKVFREIGDSQGNRTQAPYNMSLRRYTVEAQDSGSTFNSVAVDTDILLQLCADQDGCTLHLGMREWDTKYRGTGLLAMLGPIRFSLSNYAGTPGFWRSEGIKSDGTRGWFEGEDGNGTIEFPATAWDCDFSDGFYSKGAEQGEWRQGFSLTNMHETHTNPDMTCVLTIDD